MSNPPPRLGTAPHTVDLVQADLTLRKAFGVEKYGVAHQHDNGRDHLQDLYEELLDASVYARAEIEARKRYESDAVVVLVARQEREIEGLRALLCRWRYAGTGPVNPLQAVETEMRDLVDSWPLGFVRSIAQLEVKP